MQNEEITLAKTVVRQLKEERAALCAELGHSWVGENDSLHNLHCQYCGVPAQDVYAS